MLRCAMTIVSLADAFAVNYTFPVYYLMVKNITVTLDDETAAWARVYAAQQNKSLSRVLGELLQSKMHDSHAYEEAMNRFLSRDLVPFNSDGAPYPKREDLYDRAKLR